MKQLDKRGFTVVELMIATTVFSLLMLVIVGTVMQITRLHMKGLNMTRTQEVTRSVTEEVSRAIQFTPGLVQLDIAPYDGVQVYCIGLRRYSFAIGQPVGSDKRALVSTSKQDCEPDIGSDAGTELLGNNMRLAKFKVEPVDTTGDMYRVTVRVVYGDDDLLCNESDCGSDSNVNLGAGDIQCKNIRSGSQFCAMSELSTVVKRRMK